MAHKVVSIVRLNNSVNGNPRFRILLEDRHGDSEAFITQSDASFAYAIGNVGMREGDRVQVELTRNGRISRMRPIT